MDFGGTVGMLWIFFIAVRTYAFFAIPNSNFEFNFDKCYLNVMRSGESMSPPLSEIIGIMYD